MELPLAAGAPALPSRPDFLCVCEKPAPDPEGPAYEARREGRLFQLHSCRTCRKAILVEER